jgi:signal transduction histidine kinase
MINQLKRKFIMITMSSLCLVLLLLVGTINIINFNQTNQTAEETLRILSENKGEFPDFKRGIEPPREKRPGFEINEETRFQIRYFLVELDEEGTVKTLDTSHISAVTSGDALEYADDVISSAKTGGYEGYYKYKLVETAEGSMLIFLDCRKELQMVLYFLLTSGAVAIGTLLFVFILVSIFSKRAINPIIKSMEKQRQFITDAGHEIKTPLAIISANADVLELTNGESEWINSIRNQTTRLDKLVKNLLTLSRMEEDNIEISYRDFDLSSCVDTIARSFQAVAENQNKKLRIDIQLGLMFHGDEGCIEQLVSTLLDNAMKYSNDQGSIALHLTQQKKNLKLEVFNTVDGMDTKNLDRLFDRFYRSDASRSRETGGYGIGLSIAKSIVEAHHGKITAHSEDGSSIMFTVYL